AERGGGGLLSRSRAPPKLADRARDIRDGRLTPAEPRDAATVIVLRDSAAGPEGDLLRRLSSMSVAPAAYVFPGGKVAARDAEGGHGGAGPPPDKLAPALGGPVAGAAALIRAAVRETFEECGVLLAGPSADTVVGEVTGPEGEADQQALSGGSISLAE